MQGDPIALVARGLARRHRHMRGSPFAPLWAAVARWARIWPGVCPALVRAPHAVVVEDLRVVDFGT
ncbi:MAG TPA: hypothetical protein VIG69_15510 [Candidatus Methylomirabilis sp.]|jgi:hypothetical protein